MDMKGESLIEVLSVFALWRFGLYLLSSHIPFLRLPIPGLYQIIIPICILLLTRRDFESYGLTIKRWRYNLDVGMTCYLVLMVPWGLFLVLFRYGISYTEMRGAMLLGVGELLALFLLLSILRKQEKDQSPRSSANTNLLVLIALLSLPILLGFYLHRLSYNLVYTVFWQFIVSGFGEEVLNRGYFQSRVNEEFGRPYRFLGVDFGVGLIIASLLFGFSHVLNPFDPLNGSFGLAWWWGFWTFFSGIFYGFVREKTGSVVAAGIAHGLPDAVGEAIALLFSLKM